MQPVTVDFDDRHTEYFTSSVSARCNNFEVDIATDRHDLATTFKLAR